MAIAKAASIQNNLVTGSCSIIHFGAIEPKQVLVTWEKSHNHIILIVILSLSECFPIFVISSKSTVCLVLEFHPCDYEYKQTFQVCIVYLRTDRHRG